MSHPAISFCSTRILVQRLLLGLFISALFLQTADAEIILTAPPRESADAGNKLYEPLAASLSELLGKKVTYQHPGTWHNYQKQLQNDEYDIVFDGPHFAAWRMTSLKAKPLVRLPGNLRFVLVTSIEEKDITEIRDLIGKSVCTLPSPNLGALTLYSMYPNPVTQPYFKQVKGGFKQVTKELLKGECRGAILRSSFYYKKLPVETRGKFKVLKESSPIINQGITVSRRVSKDAQTKMLRALTTKSGAAAMRPILERFAHKANSFVPAQKEEYVGKNMLYDNMVYGW